MGDEKHSPEDRKEKARIRSHLVGLSIERLQQERMFEFEGLLGNGTYGDVVQMYDPVRKESIAVKIVVADNISQLEMDLWPGLRHPHIVPLLELVYLDFSDVVVLFMMPLQARTMQDVLCDKTFSSSIHCLTYVRQWSFQVLSGVEYMHHKNVCHLDIKVDNVLITMRSTAMLSDFSFLNESTDTLQRYDLGLPYIYRPPEACQSLGEDIFIDGKSYDMWGYGIMVLEAITYSSMAESISKCNSWSTQVYPLLFELLQPDILGNLMSMALPGARVTMHDVELANNFLHLFLKFDPKNRATAAIGLRHSFLGQGTSLCGDVDDIWKEEAMEKFICDQSFLVNDGFADEFDDFEDDTFSTSTEEELARLMTSTIEGIEKKAIEIPPGKQITDPKEVCSDKKEITVGDASATCVSDQDIGFSDSEDSDLKNALNSWLGTFRRSKPKRKQQLKKKVRRRTKDGEVKKETVRSEQESSPAMGDRRSSSGDSSYRRDRNKSSRCRKRSAVGYKMNNVKGIVKNTEKMYLERLKVLRLRNYRRGQHKWRRNQRHRGKEAHVLKMFCPITRGRKTRPLKISQPRRAAKRMAKTKKSFKRDSNANSSKFDTLTAESDNDFSSDDGHGAKSSNSNDWMRFGRCAHLQTTENTVCDAGNGDIFSEQTSDNSNELGFIYSNDWMKFRRCVELGAMENTACIESYGDTTSTSDTNQLSMKNTRFFSGGTSFSRKIKSLEFGFVENEKSKSFPEVSSECRSTISSPYTNNLSNKSTTELNDVPINASKTITDFEYTFSDTAKGLKEIEQKLLKVSSLSESHLTASPEGSLCLENSWPVSSKNVTCSETNLLMTSKDSPYSDSSGSKTLRQESSTISNDPSSSNDSACLIRKPLDCPINHCDSNDSGAKHYCPSAEFQPMTDNDTIFGTGDTLQDGDAVNVHQENSSSKTSLCAESDSSADRSKLSNVCLDPDCKESKSKIVVYIKTLKKQTNHLNRLVKQLEENMMCDACWATGKSKNQDAKNQDPCRNAVFTDETHSSVVYKKLDEAITSESDQERSNETQESELENYDNVWGSDGVSCRLEFKDSESDTMSFGAGSSKKVISVRKEDLEMMENCNGESDGIPAMTPRRSRRFSRWFRNQFVRLEMLLKCWSYKLMK